MSFLFRQFDAWEEILFGFILMLLALFAEDWIDRFRTRQSKEIQRMVCPKCKHADSRVIDSNRSFDGGEILRRRRCQKPTCQHTWTTRELDAARLSSRIPRSARITQKDHTSHSR